MSMYRDASQALDLLWHAARIDPMLKNAVEVVIRERDKLLECAERSCETCGWCSRCLNCGGVENFCDFHADFGKEACDCEAVE